MELKLPTPEQLRTVYRRDLAVSFPPAELKPLRSIEEMWERGWYRPWCLFEGEEIAGECFLWLGHPGWALLDYLCVSPDRRGAGLGAALLEKIRQAEPETLIYLESEAPVHAPDAVMAKRRLGFYARCGARTAGYDTEIFGIHYRTLYLSDRPVPDGALMAEHRFVYERAFSPDKFARYIRIPWDGNRPGERVPWDQ